jgi:hypothetical protein
MQWLMILVLIAAALWLAGVRLPGRQRGGCPYAGTASCGCAGKASAPRASEDLLTRS